MQNRTPVPRDQRPPLPAFTPVPRKAVRHDGWTPRRQKAFIEALADTGSVSRAAAMVNMSAEGAYCLRRQPGADEFRRAWEAALDYGVARMKDIAFERAVSGYLVPMFVGGKLIGWRRKYNDRLLMFCLRHYGEDPNGKRTTVNYFSTRATAGAQSVATTAHARSVGLDGRATQADAAGAARIDAEPDRPTGREANPIDVTNSLRDDASSFAEASTAVVRTTIAHNSGPEDLVASLGHTAAAIDGFDGIELDSQAQAEIAAVLHQCAARRRVTLGTADDEAEPFVAAIQPPRKSKRDNDPAYLNERRPIERDPPVYGVTAFPVDMVEHDPTFLVDPDEIARAGPDELRWEMLGDEEGIRAIESATAEVRAAIAKQSATEPMIEGAADGLHALAHDRTDGARPEPQLSGRKVRTKRPRTGKAAKQ